MPLSHRHSWYSVSYSPSEGGWAVSCAHPCPKHGMLPRSKPDKFWPAASTPTRRPCCAGTLPGRQWHLDTLPRTLGSTGSFSHFLFPLLTESSPQGLLYFSFHRLKSMARSCADFHLAAPRSLFPCCPSSPSSHWPVNTSVFIWTNSVKLMVF